MQLMRFVLDFRPIAVPCSVQKHRATHERNHARRSARAVAHENRCKQLHSPHDVTALRSQTRRTRRSAAPRRGVSDICSLASIWRRLFTPSMRGVEVDPVVRAGEAMRVAAMLLAARAAALAPRLPSMARSATRSTVRMDAATPEQFARIDLRVGTIVDAFNHPESEKLIVEEIDLGEPDGPRQIVSGLQDFYKASELVGKKVLVVANLPTAKLGGMPSAGMVLCGSADEKAKVEVLEPPAACEDGEPAYLEGVDADLATPNQVKKKKLWAPVAAELKLVGGVATFDGKPIETSEGTCSCASITDGPIS